MRFSLDPPTLTRRTTPGKAAFWFAFALTGVLILGSFGGRWLMLRGLNAEQGGWHEYLTVHGPAFTFRRILLLLFLLISPVVLKKIGWPGVRELGWTSTQTRGERKKDFLLWFLIGFTVSVGAGLIFVRVGSAEWIPKSISGWGLWLVMDVLVVGLLRMILWETFFRGMLYRSLARGWTPWTAAIVVSLSAAWFMAHTISVDHVERGPFSVLGGVMASPFSSVPDFRFWMNQVLLGLILCRLVHHKGDIWGAVGLHSALNIGLNLFSASLSPGQSEVRLSVQNGFRFFSSQSAGFTFGILLFWAALEWQHRRKLNSYGRIHF